MKVLVYPSNIVGSLLAPSSKSSMQRACAAALLHKGITHLYNAGISNDDKAALNIIQMLGATVEMFPDKIIITSKGFAAETEVKKNGRGIISYRILIASFLTVIS